VTMAQPIPIRRLRDRAAERVEDWRMAQQAFCDHMNRPCEACTADRLCPFGAALQEMVERAEGAMPRLALRRIDRTLFVEDVLPEADDHTPGWLNLLTEGALVVVVLFAFGLGVLIGSGGGL